MNTTLQHATDIHPEIPLQTWADDRYEDDEGRILVDRVFLDIGEVGVERSLLRQRPSTDSTEWREMGDSFHISFPVAFPDGQSEEQFAILPSQLPMMIAVLQRLHEEVTK